LVRGTLYRRTERERGAGSGAEDIFQAIRIQDPVNPLIDVLLGGRGNAGQHLGRQGIKAPG
jgi:hypothetical protein